LTVAVISSKAAAVCSKLAACCSVRLERSSDAEEISVAPHAFGKFGVDLKMQEGFETKNRPEGRRVWLQLYVPLGAAEPSR